MDRKPHVAGTFYPADALELEHTVDSLFATAGKRASRNVRAIISPHAGYIFSGKTAAAAFNQVDSSKSYERVFVIASSHVSAFGAVSVYNSGNYITPLGIIPVDTALVDVLMRDHRIFTFDKQADLNEHGIEVQLPFIQRKLKPGYKIVPVIIGTDDVQIISKLADALKPFFNDKNLFVISSDFSHYPSYEDARRIDAQTASTICLNKPGSLLALVKKQEMTSVQGLLTRLCGWTSVLTLLYITENMADISYKVVEYTNSGDSPAGEKSRVVGYTAIVASHNIEGKTFTLTEQEKKALLQLARETIVQYIATKTMHSIDPACLTPNLARECGAFVSLHKAGNLRGCIGQFSPGEPLYEVVGEMAIAAATQDHRFEQVKLDEIDSVEIEISVLTPLKRVTDVSEIVLGRHGVYVKKGNRSGTFLPQVAGQTGWDVEQFLGHCSRDKAGIGWDGWKDAELYTYEAIVFKE